MVDHIKQGEDKIAAANKLLGSWSFFGTSSSKKEDAVELLTKAANHFKMAGEWNRAGDTYSRAGELHIQLNSNYEAASSMKDAAECYKKVSMTRARESWERAIDLYAGAGRFNQIARLQLQIAEVCEEEHNIEEAIQFYQEGANTYQAQNQLSHARNALLKVANLSASLDDFARAASIFEEIGKDCLKKSISAFHAKGYFVQSLLCHLAQGDSVAVNAKLPEMENLDHTFAGTREHEFIVNITTAFDEFNSEAFAQHCSDYDRFSKLSPWYTSILLKIKRRIEDQVGDDDDVGIDLT